MTAADTCAALTANGVDLIDKHDARRIFLRLAKKVTDTGSADTDEHFYKVRAADAEERNTGLTGNSLGKEGFPCAGIAVEQNAFGDLGAQSVVAGAVFEEIDDLRQFLLNLIHTGHIAESHFFIAGSLHFGFALAELHHFSAAALTLIHHIDKYSQNDNGGDQHDQDALPPGFSRFLGEGDIHTFFIQLGNEIFLRRDRCLKDFFVFIRARCFPGVVRSHDHDLAVFTGERAFHEFR